jgi:hypothetical protein
MQLKIAIVISDPFTGTTANLITRSFDSEAVSQQKWDGLMPAVSQAIQDVVARAGTALPTPL